MDAEVKKARHAKLWEAAETNARRTAIGGVIFALLILLNVVEPHFRIEHDKSNLPQWQSELASLQQKQSELKERKQSLADVARVLGETRANIQQAPWQSDIQALINDCRGGCPADVQDRADSTIFGIGNKMRNISVAPLQAVIDQANMRDELQGAVTSMEQSIKDWEDSKLGTVWYGTIDAKSATARAVGRNVSARTQDAESAVNKLDGATEQELDSIAETLAATRAELASTQDDIESRIKDNQAKIDEAMQAALPAWATGLFTVKSMVALYPWVLVALGAFMVGAGVMAGHHYRGMADAEGWSAEERGDPVLSSPWTLTWRGYAGGAITFAAYAAVLGVFVYCLTRSVNAADPDKIAAETGLAFNAALPVNLAFVLLIAPLLLAAFSLRPRKG